MKVEDFNNALFFKFLRILGVPKEATDEDIRKQYRRFAVLVHPDKVYCRLLFTL